VGAELEEDKELGKETDVRAPIHTHARLDIFLVLFYNEANWVRGRDDIDTNGRKGNSNQPGESIQPILTIFIVGSFN